MLAALVQGVVSSVDEGMAKCAEAIDSGAAFAVLERWRKFSERTA